MSYMTLGLYPTENMIMTLRLFSSDIMTLGSFSMRIRCDGMDAVGSGSGDLDKMEIVVLSIV